MVMLTGFFFKWQQQQDSWQLHRKGYYTTLLIQVFKAEQKYDWIILNCYTTCLSKDCETRLNNIVQKVVRQK